MEIDPGARFDPVSANVRVGPRGDGHLVDDSVPLADLLEADSLRLRQFVLLPGRSFRFPELLDAGKLLLRLEPAGDDELLCRVFEKEIPPAVRRAAAFRLHT